MTPSKNVNEPLSIRQILARSFRITPQVFTPVLGLYLLLVGIETGDAVLDNSIEYSWGGLDQLLHILWLKSEFFVAQFALSTVLSVFVIVLAGQAWRGTPVRLSFAWREVSVGLVLSSILLAVRIATNAGFLLLLFILPGLIYGLNRCLAQTILILENTDRTTALHESKYLLTHRGDLPWYSLATPQWRLSGICFITWLVAFPEILLSIASFVNHRGFIAELILTASSFAFTDLVQIFSAITLVGFYFDLKLRAEGMDNRISHGGGGNALLI